ncbi:MAG: DUF6763 family protein [Nevskiales bacterium]
MQSQPHAVIVGEWYRIGAEPPFEVVAVDADQETIEIQYFDGTVEEMDFDSWTEMAPQPSVAPEDWSGAMDQDREDYGIEPERLLSDSWDSPLDHLDRLG